jgi:hypothetical protein
VLHGSHVSTVSQPATVGLWWCSLVLLRSALHGMRRPIDVRVYSEAQVEEWGEARGTVLHAALSEGRVLVEA